MASLLTKLRIKYSELIMLKVINVLLVNLSKQYLVINFLGDDRMSGAVYGFHEELVDLVTKFYGKASYTNPLHPDVFPGICKMEAIC
uniref:Longin domain-containing protein n=2 Tax=Glossina morsitans morsitans TaxID=37546 RepID=A0ABK9NGB5_GLOMM